MMGQLRRSAGSQVFAGSAAPYQMIDRGQDKSREVRRSVRGGKGNSDNGLARCVTPLFKVRLALSLRKWGALRTSRRTGRR